LLAGLSGCAEKAPPAADPGGGGNPFDAEKLRTADYSCLFIGNSHTHFHDLPGLVGRMIQFRHPGKTVYMQAMGVSHLEDAGSNPQYRERIDAGPWKAVVLQAQKISVSGKFEYSRTEGIDLAKHAKGRGAAVFYYSEWGLQGKEGDGARNEKVYREMAEAAGARVAAVNRAWDIALAQKPDLPLYSPDGNHQSELGAFVTACVLTARLTGESPAALAAFPYPAATEADRKLLADAAAEAVAKE
jgi:hypothetical protein